ncbi:thiol reductant ABC exporter subunit CydD [Quadrisphaera sp. KR29]|uniref:thiol reductant ABC exporter subunit CydD n=1 Tax=Quadrisphaera sp. KR29 TaxID=3461391 RepID=UPI0040446021
MTAQAERPASPARRLLALPGARGLVPLVAALAVGSAALAVVQWWAVAAFVAAVVSRGAAPASLVVPLAVAAAAWGTRAALAAGRDRAAARASSAVRRAVRLDLARALLRRGPDLMAAERAGELVTTATSGVSKLDAYLARAVPGSVWAAVVPVLLALAVLVLDPLTGLLLVVTGPLVVFFLWLVGTRASVASRQQWAALGQLGALLVDTVRVLPTLVAHGRARGSAQWVAEVGEAHRAATMKVLRTAFLSGFVLEFGATLSTALAAVTVGVRVFEGDLGFERALLVLLLVPEFYAPLRSLGADHHAAMEGRPAAERVFALLDAPAAAAGTGAVGTGTPHLRLHGVRLARDGREVLRGVDLDLPPGSRTALVGPSGAGKSTLVHLLLGFAQPDRGQVLVDGVPLAGLDPGAWRDRVALVPERPWLLPGPVAENVRLGAPGASDAEVEAALRRARVWDVVAALPQGVATPLGEDGARLSGGERLRIALARAFAKDAAVVVLDEPTSQLDGRTESEVLAALDELAAGRTVLTITHRSAPLGLHDRVVHLVGGRVVETAPAGPSARRAAP